MSGLFAAANEAGYSLPMTLSFKAVTYTSLAADLADEDLWKIQHEARTANVRNGITGVLIFDGERFLQYIEGPSQAIDDLVVRIRQDRRHSEFAIRDSVTISDRVMADWAMEVVHTGRMEHLVRFSPPSYSVTVRLLVSKLRLLTSSGRSME